MAQPLQIITDTWGRWKAEQLNTSLFFTASTNYGPHGQLDNYHQYQVQVANSTIEYLDGQRSVLPGNSYYTYGKYINDTGVEQTTEFSRTESSETKMLWSVTEAENLGVSVTVKVGKPGFVEGSATVERNISLSETREESASIVQQFSVHQQAKCEPYTMLEATYVLKTDKYKTPFVASTPLTGWVAVWFNDRVKISSGSGDHHLYFVPIQNVFDECYKHGIINTDGYTKRSSSVVAHAQGEFSGGQGIDYFLKMKSIPLSGREEPREYVLDNVSVGIAELDHGRMPPS
ncbi:hypothetical protein [Thalassospira australica]|uniref:hypothetical protein n=1 Tax=Thalassospira australica TaxID=1528106 RepID=UPI000AF9B94F|nr:hypothetical protein [Thalassospira australica]